MTMESLSVSNPAGEVSDALEYASHNIALSPLASMQSERLMTLLQALFSCAQQSMATTCELRNKGKETFKFEVIVRATPATKESPSGKRESTTAAFAGTLGGAV